MEDNSNNNKQPQPLSIEIKSDIAKGIYSNLAIITHSQIEFVVDFASMLPGMQKPEVLSRVIMTPENATKLLIALQDNMGKYENQYGKVNISDPRQKNTFPMGGFGPKNGNIS